MVTTRDDVVGLDSCVILPTKTWEASGHLKNFTDPLVERESATSGSAPTTSGGVRRQEGNIGCIDLDTVDRDELLALPGLRQPEGAGPRRRSST